MYKIGVIGDKNSAMSFVAFGMKAFPCADVAEAKSILAELVKEDYAIIYITENLCREMDADFEKYKDDKLPAIIPIPGLDGSHGVGVGRSKKAVERAVGADIIYGDSRS